MIFDLELNFHWPLSGDPIPTVTSLITQLENRNHRRRQPYTPIFSEIRDSVAPMVPW